MSTVTNDAPLGHIIDQGIRSARFSNRKFAGVIGVSHTAVGNWRRGTDLPDADRLDTIAWLLGLDEDLVWGAYRTAVRSRTEQRTTVESRVEPTLEKLGRLTLSTCRTFLRPGCEGTPVPAIAL